MALAGACVAALAEACVVTGVAAGVVAVPRGLAVALGCTDAGPTPVI
ncbi:MAG TPA: hypothetical protein VES02_09060 [Dermatophilaceae bacterium]|nr:hypothetical protein [Dermatophilaceae bacterium]